MPPVADWITPDWPAPAGVRALITTRNGGVGAAPYDTLNLGGHVGDDPRSVQANRALLGRRLRLPSQPLWLNQVHGCAVARCGSARPGVTADAVVADRPGAVYAVLTADCLPLAGRYLPTGPAASAPSRGWLYRWWRVLYSE